MTFDPTDSGRPTGTAKSILDLAKPNRTAADRRKLLATAADDEDNLVLVDNAVKRGPEGPRGEKGPLGPVGLQGAKGDRGDQGPDGPGITSEIILAATKTPRTTADRNKIIGISETNAAVLAPYDLPLFATTEQAKAATATDVYLSPNGLWELVSNAIVGSSPVTVTADANTRRITVSG